MEREPRRHGLLWAHVAAAWIGLCPGWADAQYGRRGSGLGMSGAGSTVQGDILRGQGIAAMGIGQFNLLTGMANSINTDTAIRWNQYVYLSMEEDLHKKYLHRLAHKERNDAYYRKNLARMLDKPNPADLRNGDALNMQLMKLADPRISPSNYRKSPVGLPGDTIRKIPFVYASRAATFSMERLIGRRTWPLSLRGSAFAVERRNYERAVDEAIELDIEGKLTGAAVDGVQQAADDLDAKIDLVIPPSRRDDFNQAKNYVRRLRDVPRMLRQVAVERVIAEIQTYPGTSVGDLVQFMQKHNLRFGVAESPEENELYANLFENLRTQSAQVTLPSDEDANEPIK